MSSYLRNLPQRVRERKYQPAPAARRLTTAADPVDQFAPTNTDEQLGQLSDVEKDFALRRMPVDGVGK